MKEKLNKTIIGLITGILVPLLTMLIYYFIKFNNITINEFIHTLTFSNIFSHILSLCVIPNLLLFFIYIWLNMLKSARGVIIATLGYAFTVAGIRYL